ncbi:hypothetical protein [Luteimonas vadosa]|uniref:Uncharacterized protein n=1 Tax=Luteimonas vadosa TaxID=1165507 RepID=A0ABP9DP13_9GAMM
MRTRIEHRIFGYGTAATILAAALAASTAAAGNPVVDLQQHDQSRGVVASATGGGHFLVGGSLDVTFAFSANQHPDGTASGHSRHQVELGGLPIDFSSEVICVSVDPQNRRAWVGAVITQNRSEHPAFTQERNQPGRDIWFRVLDNGQGQAAADRSTFVGFEGDAGIITSEEYCETMPWPADNARTSPVTQGNLQVRP